ncbi:hypothetical protein B0O99DRAFT_627227 [Bisporella sp. PMI_857]|nr:hypothetical protein B0O99DRAFT_627227 [Bisporella sp. PMI_857]
MRDEVIDDRSYAAGMLGSDQRAVNQFLNQRAASSAHAQRQGEAPPSYSHTGNEQTDDAQAKLLAAAFLAGAMHQIEKPDVDPQVGLANAMPALKKKAAPEHDYRTDYDYAFTRTLHDMEHDPGCNCDFTGADPWLQPLDEEQFKANGDLDEQLYQAMQGNNSPA